MKWEQIVFVFFKKKRKAKGRILSNGYGVKLKRTRVDEGNVTGKVTKRLLYVGAEPRFSPRHR